MLPTETIIIAGPTGAGKTDLSLRLAEHLGGEIVGADAFQIYKGIPLLTSQPSADQQDRIPHHLIGSVDPKETFDAGRYQKTAEPILQDIVSRRRVPIVVGGTGLYLRALLGGLDELPATDAALREEFVRYDLATLIQRLHEADPEAGKTIDLANRRRVERALEIIQLTGKPLAASRSNKSGTEIPVHGLLLIREREDLYARIEAHVQAMFARGVDAEVAALPQDQIGSTASMTLGLRDIQALVSGEITRDEAIARITVATRRYAKRQITWFKNQHSFPTLNLSPSSSDQALKEALNLLGKK